MKKLLTNKFVSTILSILVSFLFVYAFATSTTTISSTGITTTGSSSFVDFTATGTTTLSATTTINGVNYYWPFADGSASQVLATDGAGNLTWTTAAGGGGFSGGPLDAQYFNATSTGTTTSGFMLDGTVYLTNGGNTSSIFLGKDAGRSITDGVENTLIGIKAGENITGGDINTFVGDYAGWSNTTGSYNTFLGPYPGYFNTTGSFNIGIGEDAINSNTTGDYNIGLGSQAGWRNETGSNNLYLGNGAGRGSGAYSATALTLVGHQAGYNNTVSSSTFMGYQSGYSNTTGASNSIFGYQAGYSNTTGQYNLLMGKLAGYRNSTGSWNTILASYEDSYTTYGNMDGGSNVLVGYNAGLKLTTGDSNTIVGQGSGVELTTGSYNVALGEYALGNGWGFPVTGIENVAIGVEVLGQITTGSDNTSMGYYSGYSLTSGSDNLLLGAYAGYDLISATGTTLVGNYAGYNNTVSSSTFLGYQSGYSNTTGPKNTFFGYQAGYGNVDGYENVFMGYKSGSTAGSAYRSVFLGAETGMSLTDSYGEEVYVGYRAGASSTVGWGDVYLGYQAGEFNQDGDNNTFIGNNAGRNNNGSSNIFIGSDTDIAGSNKLVIDYGGTSSTTALIYGEFDNDILVFNAKVGISSTSPTAALTVESQDADSATVVASIIDTNTAWTTAGSKLLSVRNNGTEKMFVDDSGRLVVGGNVVAYGGVVDEATLIGVRDASQGASGNNQIFVAATDNINGDHYSEFNAKNYLNGTSPWSNMYLDSWSTTNDIYSTFNVTTKTDGNTNTVGFSDQRTSGTSEFLLKTNQGTISDNNYISFQINNTNRLKLNPSVADGASAVAYELDTHNALANATAKLLSVQNQNAEKFSVLANGDVNLSGDIYSTDSATSLTINGFNATSGDTAGNYIQLIGGNGFGAGTGGGVILNGASGGATGNGGTTSMYGGTGGATSGSGGIVELVGGDASTQGDGGNVEFWTGNGAGTGIPGKFVFYDPTQSYGSILDFSNVASDALTYSVPNWSGNFLVSSSTSLYQAANGDIGIGAVPNNTGLLELTENSSRDLDGLFVDNIQNGSYGGGVNVSLGGTATDKYGIYSFVNGASTNNYASYFTASGATNNYAVYSAAGLNYFAGNVGIGSTSPTAALTVESQDADSATAVASIIDTNTAWTTEGSKLLSVRNGGTERMALNAQTGGLMIGEDPITLWASAEPSLALAVLHDWTDTNDNGMLVDFSMVDSPNWNEYSEFRFSTTNFKTANPTMQGNMTYYDSGNGFDSAINQIISGDDVSLYMTSDATVRTYLHPSVADGASAVAYELDTHNLLTTSAKLLSIQNQNTEKFSVDSSGTTTMAGVLKVTAAGATSTISSNLHVQGTLRAAVSYVGDLIFANNFRFYEDPMPIDGVIQEGTQTLKLTNQRNEDIFSIDEDGNLTIKGQLVQATTTEESVLSLGLTWILDQFKSIGVTIADGIVSAREFIGSSIKATDEFCLGSQCITESQFKELLEKNSIGSAVPPPAVVDSTSTTADTPAESATASSTDATFTEPTATTTSPEASLPVATEETGSTDSSTSVPQPETPIDNAPQSEEVAPAT